MAKKNEGKRKRSAADFLPPRPTSLAALKKAAASCKGCDLYKNATQTVFGEGTKDARVVFVGEQPGDFEDRAGKPFVGPAGRAFDKALAEAHLDRNLTYVTNAVKHFKWIPMGKRRKHQRPLVSEIMACRPWLEAELRIIRPSVLVCMGATAAQSIFERKIQLQKERGKFMPSKWSPATFITIHPSSIYRHPEREKQKEEYRHFVEDMKAISRRLGEVENQRKIA